MELTKREERIVKRARRARRWDPIAMWILGIAGVAFLIAAGVVWLDLRACVPQFLETFSGLSDICETKEENDLLMRFMVVYFGVLSLSNALMLTFFSAVFYLTLLGALFGRRGERRLLLKLLDEQQVKSDEDGAPEG